MGVPAQGEADKGIRAVALVGPVGTGKTSLAEALLYASGAVERQGSVANGNCIGDATPEARARGGSTEINLARLDFLGDRFVLVDAPGAAGFAADATRAIAAADMAVVVVDPDPARAPLVEPTLHMLDELGVPHALFVNKIDCARGSISALLEALQPMSKAALVARQIPISEGEKVTGFVDLALERAYHYRAGLPSEQIMLPEALADRERADRFHMLEQLSDHDDELLEQLLSDVTPSREMIFADCTRELGDNVAVPVMFGSAANGFGVRRLLKLLRHEAPCAAAAGERLGIERAGAYVVKVSHAGTVGRLAITRVFGGTLSEGAELTTVDGRTTRAGALFTVQGPATAKTGAAGAGDIIAIAKAEAAEAGSALGIGHTPAAPLPIDAAPVPNCALAIATRDRKDDVRLSAALNKLAEEDPGIAWAHDEALHETILRAQTDDHLKVTLDRLKRRYGVAVDTQRPGTAYRESIRKSASQRGRHKKQSGGHGQFGDVVIEVGPRQRGEGFAFGERITGGAVPKQWIPAVEAGVSDACMRGPLGFPVVDVGVTLVDGSYHSVDSSELAFRTAARIAMAEALAGCAPYLLEPMAHVTILAPGFASSRISSAVAGRRGQMLGIAPAEGWSRWTRSCAR
jgi:elongation factor G